MVKAASGAYQSNPSLIDTHRFLETPGTVGNDAWNALD
ncbi:hypothetical protein J3R75_002625 [Oligosphaera ethanolica]|uniref:Uncharacterized protein n=1 Tax=Oligosphaera ethanolica TaxID=760260 RepID=A0AAE4APY8_9BACT|nr:hypothetical protein [Oligosphaera ethanolica]